MKIMKKILILLITVTSGFFLGCEKDTSTEDKSIITYYVSIDLEGNETLSLPLGTSYQEPGYVAMEGETDVSGDVNVVGTVNSAQTGLYTLAYKAKNADGFDSEVTRTVIIYDPEAPETDLSGSYTGTRVGRGGGPVSITKLAPGIFSASDFFGGYYEYIAGYGSAYRLSTIFQLNADNTYISLSNTSPWGPWQILNGTYDPEQQVLSHVSEQDGFEFNVTLTKQ